MTDHSQTATNKQSEPTLCKQGCGFFVSIRYVLENYRIAVGEREDSAFPPSKRCSVGILSRLRPLFGL